MNTLLLLRGLPGSGKSKLAKKLEDVAMKPNAWDSSVVTISADDFRYNEQGKYVFSPETLEESHFKCQNRTKEYLKDGIPFVVVYNTFTLEEEIEPYKELSQKYGYTFVSCIVENRHGGKSKYNVPEKTLEAMRNRFSIIL